MLILVRLPYLFLFSHLVIVSFFVTCLYFSSKGYYDICVWASIGFTYVMLTTIVFSYMNLFNSLFFIPLSLNALIYFPEKKKISLFILIFYLISCFIFFLIELRFFSFKENTLFQELNMKAAMGFLAYLLVYKVTGFLLMYWQTLSSKEASEEGVRQFLAMTTEGIYHISFKTPISIDLPIAEQYVLFKREGYFLECNNAFAALYNYPDRNALHGLSVQDFVANLPDTGMAVTFPDLAASNYSLQNKASRELDQKGNYIHLLNNVFGVVEDGYLKSIWGTQRDISELKATQDTMVMRDAYIEKLMANFPVVYYRFDKNLTFTLSVGGALQRLNLMPNQVVGQNIREMYQHEPKIIADHEVILAGGVHSFLSKVKMEEGELFFDTRVTFDQEKQEGFGFALETTERKIAENTLLKSENRYKNLFNSTFDAILVYNTHIGLVEECNENARIMFEVAEEVDVQTLSPIYLAPQYQPDGTLSSRKVAEFIQKLKSHKRLQFEFFHKRLGGEVFETETTLIPSSFDHDEILVIIRDVSKKRHAERALRTRERQLKEAQKVARLGSWQYDYHTSLFSGSEELHNMFDIENSTQTTFEDCMEALVSTDHLPTMIKVKNDVDRKAFNFTYQKQCKSNGTGWFQMTGKKSFDEEGRPSRISGIVQDVTTKYQQEEIIRKALKALNEKNEDLKKYIDSNLQLENFAYMASHDLKAPIRTIVSFSQLLKRSLKDRLNDNEEEYLHYISTGANSMKNLIEDLLTYSRVNTNNHQVEKVSLSTILERIQTDLKSALEASQATLKVKNIPNYIHADSTMMRQLFQNLVENAIKFRRSGVAPKIEIGCKGSEDYWNFYIKDNGIGVSPEFQEKIFLLFRKLHSSSQYEGTGIGLALCKKIVEQHGGKIWVDGQYRNGTCFHFTLGKQLMLNLVDR